MQNIGLRVLRSRLHYLRWIFLLFYCKKWTNVSDCKAWWANALVRNWKSHTCVTVIYRNHPGMCLDTSDFGNIKTCVWKMDATLISDALKWQHKAACRVRAAVSGHRHCEQIAVHMLLIELCRAPIVHCLRSKTLSQPLVFYCHQLAQLIPPIRTNMLRM